MRVISGIYRGRKLECLEGRDIRPTSDRVKESLFNILSSHVIESTFFDMFGGTGSIGIEAISRGASLAVFVDESIQSIKVLRANLEKLGINEKVEVYNTDYITAVNQLFKSKKKFDFIFIDPPYHLGIAQNALNVVDEQCILESNGMIIVEHNEEDTMPKNVGSLMMQRQRKYGSTILTFYKQLKKTADEEE